MAALLLQNRNADAAQSLLPQREAEELVAPLVAATTGLLVCKGDSGRLPLFLATIGTRHVNPGFNPYVFQALVAEPEKSAADPHSVLRGNHTPAALLFPECNYIPWSGTVDYRKTLPNLKVYYILRAGHYIQFEQPELMRRVILAFLLDQPDAIPPYTGDADPRTLSP